MSTKEKIFKSALKLFSAQGIDKTSTAQITKEVGIAEGTLFVHFKTKQELVGALYVSIKKKKLSSLADVIDPKTSVEKNIKNIAKTVIEYFASNYSEFIFMELVENDPQVSKKTVQVGSEVYKSISEAFAKWQHDGQLKKMDLAVLQMIIWNIMLVIIKSMKAKKTKKVSSIYLDVIWEAVKKK